jgi:hypothetical protein
MDAAAGRVGLPSAASAAARRARPSRDGPPRHHVGGPLSSQLTLLDTLTVTTRKINTADDARTTSATAMTHTDLHVVIQNDGQHPRASAGSRWAGGAEPAATGYLRGHPFRTPAGPTQVSIPPSPCLPATRAPGHSLAEPACHETARLRVPSTGPRSPSCGAATRSSSRRPRWCCGTRVAAPWPGRTGHRRPVVRQPPPGTYAPRIRTRPSTSPSRPFVVTISSTPATSPVATTSASSSGNPPNRARNRAATCPISRSTART